MCVQFFKIKSRSRYAPKSAFVPCGKCVECRQMMKNQWSFRLRTELEWCRKNNWHIGFFTLTYSDKHLPTIPSEIAGKDGVMCFSRKDCRDFIDNIRKRLDERDVHGLKYMLCCEYGEHTQRSHMHGLVCWPSDVSDDDMFKLIHNQWKKGHVFPRYISGGLDSHGYNHKPFVVNGDIASAAAYAAKYCCKDIGYYQMLVDAGIDPKDKDIKTFKPFHIQSRSIGLCYYDSLDSKELLNLLKNGDSFVGSSKRLNLPIYIKNKILYSPHYHYEPCKYGDWWYDFELDKWRYKQGEGTHRRIVGRKATKFLMDNYREVFEQKVDYYEDLFTRMATPDFWTKRRCPAAFAPHTLLSEVFAHRFGPRALAEYYLAYYGVPKNKCYWTDSNASFWLTRYIPDAKIGRRKPLISESYYDKMNTLVTYCVDWLKFCVTADEVLLRKIDKIHDYYSHSI